MTGEITQLLRQWSDGDVEALAQVMPLAYDELKKLALHHLRKQGDNMTLQPTAVVNEAYLRLVNQQRVNLECRAQFFGLAAKIMRDLLVDEARKRQSRKRGGDAQRISLTGVELAGQTSPIDLLALDQALHKLAVNKPQHSRIVELRFFGGMTIDETAEALGISHAKV
ncbi:MAG TPA: ECF-type sigma factor, partial [Blastocatellia bacterium]|nr:ECF-type sigma factor [Blastocatellia bacterium]